VKPQKWTHLQTQNEVKIVTVAPDIFCAIDCHEAKLKKTAAAADRLKANAEALSFIQ